MKDLLLDLENAKNAKELYQLLSTYNAYCLLLMKAKRAYEDEKILFKNYYPNTDCYEEQIENLFGSFNSDECIKAKQLSGAKGKDMLFLIDHDTLLRMNSFDIVTSNIAGLSHIDYDLIKINNCQAKVFEKQVYYRDPYYCVTHYENKDAFGLFYDGKLVTPSYALNNQLKAHDNMDIREILKVQSFDDIYSRISEAKNAKAKKLTLKRK